MPDATILQFPSTYASRREWAYEMWRDAVLKLDSAREALEDYRIALALTWRLRRNTYRSLGIINNEPMSAGIGIYRRQKERVRVLEALVPQLERVYLRGREYENQ